MNRKRLSDYGIRVGCMPTGPLDKITDEVDTFSLEAIGGTNGKFEIINRAKQDRIERRRVVGCVFRLNAIRALFRVDRAKDGELILKNAH